MITAVLKAYRKYELKASIWYLCTVLPYLVYSKTNMALVKRGLTIKPYSCTILQLKTSKKWMGYLFVSPGILQINAVLRLWHDIYPYQVVDINLCKLLNSLHFSTSIGPDWEYLQQSIVPTDCFQKSLPRLPIPKLGETCERYLDSQQVILTPDEFEQTRVATVKFLEEDGKCMSCRFL